MLPIPDAVTPYLIQRVFDPVTTENLSQVLSALDNALRSAVWQGVVLIGELIFDRGELVDLEIESILLRTERTDALRKCNTERSPGHSHPSGISIKHPPS